MLPIESSKTKISREKLKNLLWNLQDQYGSNPLQPKKADCKRTLVLLKIGAEQWSFRKELIKVLTIFFLYWVIIPISLPLE